MRLRALSFWIYGARSIRPGGGVPHGFVETLRVYIYVCFYCPFLLVASLLLMPFVTSSFLFRS